MILENKFCVSLTKSGIFCTKWYGQEITVEETMNLVAWLIIMLRKSKHPNYTLDDLLAAIENGLVRDSLFHPLINFESRYPSSEGKG